MQTFICLGVLFSTGVSFTFVHHQAPLEAPSTNDYKGQLLYTPGPGRALMGMKSWHDNGPEDRQYQMYFGEGNGLKCTALSFTSWKNDYDWSFGYNCPTNQAMAGIQSIFDNNKKDRRWKFQCCDLMAGDFFLVGATVSGWVNEWDQEMDFECNKQEVMIGVQSYHNNNAEDRRWKITCGLLQKIGDIQEYPKAAQEGNINGYQENFTFDFQDSPKAKIFTGLQSEHNNDYEDRIWRPYSSYIPEGMTCLYNPWTEYQNEPEEAFTFKCPDNHVMVGFSAKYDTKAHDRQFRFRCCHVGGGWKVTDVRSMGWANNPSENSDLGFDGFVKGQCSLNEALLGFESYHDNKYEDRRFKFFCGMLEKDYDDCTAVSVIEYEIQEDAIEYGEEQIKNMNQYSAHFDQCGKPNAANEVTITIENQESIEVTESFSMTESLDEHFSFSQELETTFTIGQTITTAIEASVGAGIFGASASTEMSTSYEFALRTALASEQGFAIGSEDTTTEETATANIQVFTTEASYTPEPWQWHEVSAEYIEMEVVVPVRMMAQCIRKDGSLKTEWIDTQVVGAAYTQVSIKYEDLTALCPESYYHNCECVDGMASDFVGAGCTVHPNFDGHKGCYVYAGQEGCGNGAGLGAAEPAETQIICTDLEECPGSQSYLDYPVDANVFEWSYVPCGGEQYYPGDDGYTGPDYVDLVYKHENFHCLGSTIGDTAYETVHEAITECDYMNYLEPETCAGVYDVACTGKPAIYLCSMSVHPVYTYSSASCVYDMQNKVPSSPVGGVGRRRSSEMLPPSEPASWTTLSCAERQAIFGTDFDSTDCNDGTL